MADTLAWPVGLPGLLQVTHAGLSRNPPGGWYSHDKVRHEISLVTSGRCVGRINDEPATLETGHAYLVGPGDTVRVAGDPDAGEYICRWAHFEYVRGAGAGAGAGGGRGAGMGNSVNLPRVIRLNPAALEEFQRVFDGLLECFWRGWPGWQFGAAGYGLALVSLIQREAAGGAGFGWSAGAGAEGTATAREAQDRGLDRRLGVALAFLERNFTKNLKIGAIAESARMSEGYFGRVFRRRFGVGPLAYLIRLRVQEARRLLAQEPTLGIAEVARKAGFGDAKYFATTFKAQYHTSPSGFRRSLRWGRG